MQQQLACQKQELLLLRTEAERQWQMHEQAVCSQLQLGQVTQRLKGSGRAAAEWPASAEQRRSFMRDS